METLRTLVVTKIAPLKDLHEKTVSLYTASLDRFAEYLGREPVIDDLEDLVVATFLRWRSENCRRLWGKKPLSRASLAKDSAHLRSIWNWCAKKRMKKSNGDLLEFPDYKRPTVPRPRPRAYTADDLRRLMDAARHRRGYLGDIPAAWFWTTILRALFETGGRIGEMISLRWAECDLEQMSITFLAETRKGRYETITRAISPQLAGRLAVHKRAAGDLVWPWMEQRAANSLYGSLRVLCRVAQVDYQSFHSIRKATASYMKLAGHSAKTQLGHSTEEMAERHYYDERIVGTQSAVDHLPDIG